MAPPPPVTAAGSASADAAADGAGAAAAAAAASGGGSWSRSLGRWHRSQVEAASQPSPRQDPSAAVAAVAAAAAATEAPAEPLAAQVGGDEGSDGACATPPAEAAAAAAAASTEAPAEPLEAPGSGDASGGGVCAAPPAEATSAATPAARPEAPAGPLAALGGDDGVRAAPLAEAAAAAASSLPSDKAEPEAICAFCVGDAVCVFRRSAGTWSRDGVVVKVLTEPSRVGPGLHMPAGAVKVVYDKRCTAMCEKWIPPAEFGTELVRADFAAGDSVSVLCRGVGRWVADGLVVEVLSEEGAAAGGAAPAAMPAGSVKVTYAGGDMAKWIPPEAFPQELRAQRCWSGECADDRPRAVQRAGGFARGLKGLGSIMRLVRGREGPAQATAGKKAPEQTVESHNDDLEAYIVSGVAGVASSVIGRYRRVGNHNDRPKYRNGHGAVIYFDEHWKMNTKDDMSHWRYEVPGAAGEQPPTQAWVADPSYGESSGPPPTVARAVDVEVLAVSGVVGSGRAVNGRYVEVGACNDRPKYKNSSGAIVFFDGCWKMNDREDELAWRYAAEGGSTGHLPPAGEWAAQCALGRDEAAPRVRVCGGPGRVAKS